MTYKKAQFSYLETPAEHLLPGVSVDCVILGFHNGSLKILLNKFKNLDRWMLPGGFILKQEDVDTAAYRVLKERTGLEKVYLKQFHLFGSVERTNIGDNREILKINEIGLGVENSNHWFSQRFVSLGYYALIEYSKVVTQASEHEDVEWFLLEDIPNNLYSDHNRIIEEAINTIRLTMGNIPIGYELLPEKFRLSELRIIHETLLNKKMDRRNFQRRVLSSGIVVKLDEINKQWGQKPATLFSFDKEKYDNALKNGLHTFD